MTETNYKNFEAAAGAMKNKGSGRLVVSFRVFVGDEIRAPVLWG